MRVLVTGANGQLGGDLTAAAERARHDVIALDVADLDITVPGAAADALSAHRPTVVVNCAAYTHVDRAESEPERAHAVNASGAGALASACADAGVGLVHLSTDYVFDGTATAPVPEDATPRPVNAYGLSKLAGERAVLAAHPGACVVRTAWLFGRAGPNFVLTVLELARREGELRVVTDQRGSPTWSAHLAAAIVRLLRRDAPPIVHLTAGGEATWYDLAVAVMEEAGLGHVRVVPITTSEMRRPALRPAYSVLDNGVWRAMGETPLPSWRVGLRSYLREIDELRTVR